MEILVMASALASRLDSIKLRAGIKSRDVARLLDTTPETVSRWRKGRAEPQPERLQRLLTLEWLVTELSEFYSPGEAKLWLFSPHRLLGGESPEKRIRDGKLDDVLRLIEQLKTGGYV
jgi:transcriptional regulator with XRE-family HTH domain